MNAQDQRIAIAEACGWHDWRGIESASERVRAFGDVIPDYLNDLNAMHEAEKIFKGNDINKYAIILEELTPSLFSNGFETIHATASERAEAFLKTLNLWKYNQTTPTSPTTSKLATPK